MPKMEITSPLLWSDEFEYTGKPLKENWIPQIGSNKGWGNKELEHYTDRNAECANGMLKITTQKENGVYTSSRLKSKQSFKYGIFTASLKLPLGRGTWYNIS